MPSPNLQPWLREFPVWVNPPFYLLGVVVRHIRAYGAHALVLCPHCSPSLQALRGLSKAEVVLPRVPLFLRQGWDPMPTPPWGTSVFYVHHWLVGKGSISIFRGGLSWIGTPRWRGEHSAFLIAG